MKKLLLTAVLAVGALLTGASEGNAGFFIGVSSTTPFFDFDNSNGVGPNSSPFTPPLLSGNNAGNNLTVSGVTISAADSIVYDSLTSTFTITNAQRAGAFPTGITLPEIFVTVVQNAFTFGPLQNELNSSFTVTSTYAGSSTEETRITQTAFAGSSSLTLGTVSSTAGNFSATRSGYTQFAPGGANPTSIVQVFRIENFRLGQALTFNSTSAVSTPLPATAIGMLAGLPLLGLGGYIRRRFSA